MELIPYDKKKIGKIVTHRKHNKLYKLLMDFQESPLDCIKIDVTNYKNAHTCDASLRCTLKRHHLNGIRPVIRGNDVYLIKKDI